VHGSQIITPILQHKPNKRAIQRLKRAGQLKFSRNSFNKTEQFQSLSSNFLNIVTKSKRTIKSNIKVHSTVTWLLKRNVIDSVCKHDVFIGTGVGHNMTFSDTKLQA